MNDLSEALSEWGAQRSSRPSLRLESAALADATVEAVTRGRRRRALGHTSVAAVAVGGAAWAVVAGLPEGVQVPLPAASEVPAPEASAAPTAVPSDAPTIALRSLVTPMPSCTADLPGEPYVPLAEPGVYASELADETNLRVHASVSDVWAGIPVENPVESPLVDTSLWVEGDPIEDEVSIQVPQFAVEVQVTWAGQHHFEPTAWVYLESEGRLVGTSAGEAVDPRAVEAIYLGLPEYDPIADVSSVTLSVPLSPNCLAQFSDGSSINETLPQDAMPPGQDGGDGTEDASAEDLTVESLVSAEPAALRLWVQVVDEEGVPFYTEVDAGELEGTQIDFAGVIADGRGVDLVPPTEAEVAASRASFEANALPPSPTRGAQLDAKFADVTEPLGVVSIGVAPATSCTATVGQWAAHGDDLPVRAVRAPAPQFPPLSLSQIQRAKDVARPYAGAEDVEWWSGVDLTWIFSNADGEVVGTAMATTETDEINGHLVLVWHGQGPCVDTGGLEPGTYDVTVVAHGAPYEVTRAFVDDSAQVLNLWARMGQVELHL